LPNAHKGRYWKTAAIATPVMMDQNPLLKRMIGAKTPTNKNGRPDSQSIFVRQYATKEAKARSQKSGPNARACSDKPTKTHIRKMPTRETKVTFYALGSASSGLSAGISGFDTTNT
jgi:hypothetical protein